MKIIHNGRNLATVPFKFQVISNPSNDILYKTTPMGVNKVQTHLYPVLKCLQIILQEKLHEVFKKF